MATSHNFEALLIPNTAIQVIAPIGLTDFAQRVIPEALSNLESAGKKVRVRVIPVPSLRHGETAAFYTSKKDYLQVNIPLYQLRTYLYQRALVRLATFAENLRPRLAEFDEHALLAIKGSSHGIQKALTKSEEKPPWIDYTQEQYEVNRDFEIVEQAMNVYLCFLQEGLEIFKHNLSADQHSTFIRFVQFIEKELFSISDEEISIHLQSATLLPHSYSLFMCFGYLNPRNTDGSSQFVELVKDSVEHERIHQVFAHERNPTLVVDLEKMLGQINLEMLVPESDEECQVLHTSHINRRAKVINAVAQVIEGNKTFDDVFSTLEAANQETLLEIIPTTFPKDLQQGLRLRAYFNGLEESLIAIFSARRHKVHYLLELSEYVTQFNFLLPSIEVLQALENIVTKNGDDIKGMVKTVLADFYSPDAFRKFFNTNLDASQDMGS